VMYRDVYSSDAWSTEVIGYDVMHRIDRAS